MTLQTTLVRTFSIYNVRGNCRFLNHLPTPVLCVIVKWSLSNDVTIVANSPITSLPTSNIEVHNDADEKLEIQGKKIMFQYLVTCLRNVQ